jgi:Cu/Ag efflux protein CusF
MVLAVHPSDRTVIVFHRDIPRYMPAMSMPFRVRKPAELTGLFLGAQIEFDLVTRKSGSHIERLRRLGGGSVIEDQGDRIALPPNPE